MSTLSPAAQSIIAAAIQLPEAERRAVAAAILAYSAAPSVAAPPVVEIGYKDEPLSAGRPPEKLFFFSPTGLEIYKFEGRSIPGVCVVKSSNYVKNGKWSHTAYRLVISPGFSPCALRIEMHQDGVFSGCGTWAEAAARIHRSGAPANLDLRIVQDFLKTHFAKAHERIAENEAQLAALNPSSHPA